MTHYITEAERDDARRDEYYERCVRECPECHEETLVLTQRFEASRTEPGCTLWECPCGHEEEE